MKVFLIEARDIPDAWFLCLSRLLEEGEVYRVDCGSFEGGRRLEFRGVVVVHIKYPECRPLVPDIPPHLNIPSPVDMEYVEKEYLWKLCCGDSVSEGEDYTYGMYLEEQIEKVIDMYRKYGFGTNQACMSSCDSNSLNLSNPPCLRQIDTRIYPDEKKLHFILYFRSWDLWGGFPTNLSGLQLLKEYMSSEIGVDPGETIAISKGMHLYEYVWDLARARVGKVDFPKRGSEGNS